MLGKYVKVPGCSQKVYTISTRPDSVRTGTKWWHQSKESGHHSCHSESVREGQGKVQAKTQLRVGFNVYGFTQR